LKETVNESHEEIINDLKRLIKSKIAAYAIPEYFLVTPNLPKTRWGKLMRRILRKIAANKPDELGDISTLSDPNVVENIINGHNKLNRKKKVHFY
jgi:acetyl-CoA synthetase